MKIPVSKAYAKWMAEDAERLNAMAELARKVAVTLPSKEEAEKRAFCPTGSGNGVDNSCSSVSANDPSLAERVPFKPIGDGKNSDFIRVPSVDELTEALTGSNSSKGTKIGSAKDIATGTPVALRIDIPAFNYSTKNMGKAIYAVTIHENKGGKSFGSPLAYEPMARLTGPVTFAAKEKEATKVATGEANKFPLATVKGQFDQSRVMPPDIDSWTPVGYDPKKAAYFYDKKTGREVMGGTDAVSVGNSVFVRVPKYGYRNAKETYRDAGFWGVEYRDDCGRQDGGKFGPGNQCQEEGSGDTATADKPSTPASTKMPTAKVGDPANGTAWLSPSGQFYPVPRVKPPALRLKSPSGFTTHDEWASLHGHEDGEDGLLKAGWARVAKMGGESFVQTVGSPLTSKQRKSLEDQAIIAGYDSIVHDMAPSMDDRGGPGTKHKTIWSKGDRSWRASGEDRAFCPTGEGGGVKNDCSPSDVGGSGKQALPKSKPGDPKSDQAWLSPSGQFHPVDRKDGNWGWRTHHQWARENGFEGGEKELFGNGWMRVVVMGNSVYGSNDLGRQMTDRQKKSLKDHALLMGHDEAVYDNGQNQSAFWSKDSRAFCPTGEGGGVKNDCPPSEGGSSSSDNSSSSSTTTAEKPQSNLFSKDENTQWSPASGREPFPGASRYSDISVSGGKSVSKSFDSLGIKPEDAVSLLGAPERSSVFMRPAPEFGQKFYAFSGTDTPPVFMGFEADVAGIRRGLEGTYVLGSRKNNETGKQDLVLYGNVMDVLPAVSATPERRHAAARAFYKTMTSGIENARKAGVSTVMFSAAGKSADSDRAGSFRGYTIWPRMGFDGPLPKHIVAKLPPDLSHARTLMDLHATREGTKWWASNGEDIDVELNLADRNSPQNKVFDRFVKHFSRDRRDLPPLGDGEGWLSPEDLARLDEMWGEIWDDEDILDDYDGGEQKFVVESRAFCATGEGNGIDNSCSSSGAGSSATKAVLKAVTQNVSHDDLTALVATAIGTKKGWFTKPEKGEISPSRLCRDCGIQNINSDELDQIHSTARQSDREGIASAIAGVLTYAQKDPSILKASLSVDTIYTISKKSGESAFSFVGTGAMYSPIDDTIHILTSASLTSMQRAHERGFIAGSGMDYVIAHEHAHKMHYDELAKSSPRPSDKSQMDEWRYNALASSTNAVVNRMNTDPGFRGVIEGTLPKISQYATSDPFEAYAEYSAAVRLGLMKNDSGMDDFCRTVGGPVPKRIKK